ncbi:Trp biosynthesis-associated membrane protein [Jidongwangia harbinensis]|uniref:Trp biosynthesis-associated membrane protein n=1 Tax=Jidongwangia harbinensis TaxID=2878561 RepID=UPI001CD97D8C|nr:Trp biosynthesis-associated membrane protein [Jidongwangia harbinensis]MCA2212338.1 Trp biosynthesis-associated membrane protein [Jidongwangia harbinensis]
MRRLPHAVIAVLAGAGLALYAATRTWSVRLTERPGLSDLRAEATGAAEMPWLPALALVALAGAGAMLATRGTVRRALGVLLVAGGAGLVLSAIVARAGLDPGAAGAAATIWPAACVLGGALVGLGGLGAVRHGRHWPVMGARYERRAVRSAAIDSVSESASSAATASATTPAAGPGAGTTAAGSASARATAGPIAGSAGSRDEVTGEASGSAPAGRDGQPGRDGQRAEEPVDTRAVWDALDRGEDPTAR